ncbi:MAG: DUF2304 domain-containing protein [Nitrospinae bacterium]|nr:DUF2304 domain-containing protein [Nitrospinota bacterium]
MPLEQYIFSMLISLVVIVVIFELVRQRKLKEEFSVLWVFIGIGILFFANGYDTVVEITTLVGATTSTTIVFIFAILVLLAMNLHFSIRISQMSNHIKNLTQEIALLRVEEQEQAKEDKS